MKGKDYEVWKSKKGKKIIRYQLLGIGDGSVPYNAIELIIKAEFPNVRRSLIKFSVDSDALYFGNDLL